MHDLARRLAALKKLTRREMEVLRLLCEDLTQREIRVRLVLSMSTVKFHCGNIYDKLEVSDLEVGPRQRDLGRYCSILHLMDAEEPAISTPPPKSRPELPPPRPTIRALAAAEEDDKEREKRRQEEQRRRRAIVPSTPTATQPWQAEPPRPPVQPPRRMPPLLLIGLSAVIAVLLIAILIALITGRNDAQPTVVQQIITVTVVPTAPPTPVLVSSPTAAPTATPPPATPVPPTSTPPPVQPGTVLYAADWSSGPNGWPSVGGWKVLGGMLLNDGTGEGNWAYAPVNLAAHPDYAVEADIQVLNTSCPRFGIVVRDGYWAGFMSNCNPQVYIGVMDKGGNTRIAEPGTRIAERFINPGREWHRYRVEVEGNTIRFLVDGALMLEASDNRYLSPGKVALFSDHAQTNVRSFTIIKQ